MQNKMLIVYYSVSNGNTERIAEQLQKVTGADIARIETLEPYTGSYEEIVEQGQCEVNAGYRPGIKALEKNLESYDVVAVGTPTWWYTMAPAMLAFLKKYNWNGKIVIPFHTHGGWPGHVIKDIKAACKGAEFVHEMAVQFDSTGGDNLETPVDEIISWMEQIKREIE